MSEKTNLTVLGSTGSIGVNTLDVIARQSDRYSVYAITANNNIDILFEQCIRFQPRYAVVVNASAAVQLRARLADAGCAVEVLDGERALCDVAAAEETEVVMAGIVGAAGMRSTFAAIVAGKRVLIANKEPVVMAGALMLETAREAGASIFPVDSEHNAIMQCLPASFDVVANPDTSGITRLILTGSGGPFRTRPLGEFDSITPAQACAHPNWVMGPKISIDSATMMNKALELIEACVLFNRPSADIDIILHPQSIIHSMVEYADGSVLAQMGSPDMRIPIASALAWPRRIGSGAEKLDFTHLPALEFELPVETRYPSLRLVRQVIEAGGSAACVMNAANEVAVEAFMQDRLKFSQIVNVIEKVLNVCDIGYLDDLDSVFEIDQQARSVTQGLLNNHSA